MLPKMGKVVIYRLLSHEEKSDRFVPDAEATECPAIITKVHSDTCLNLRLIQDDEEIPRRKTSVVKGSDLGTWHWPATV